MKLRCSRKKSVLAIFGIICIVGIGATLMISRDSSTSVNEFALANYQTSFTEEFSSPTNWLTCQTVPKTITAKNENADTSIAVRIKLEEDWIASDGTTHLPLVSATSGLTMAQVNFTQNSGWTKIGSWYVYDTDLAPGASTSSLLTGVTFNCDANLDQSDDADASSDGAYADATYHLKATIQTIQADKKDEWIPTLTSIIASQANDPYEIDFARKASVSNDPYTANGNGVNIFTENGEDIYYYRGTIDDNNVIWANYCWLMMRTTSTGGVKMIYNGLPTEVDGNKQCLAAGRNGALIDSSLSIGGKKYYFNDFTSSPADVGYMYGDRISGGVVSAGSTVFVLSNDVSRSADGQTYTLDTSSGQSISGNWGDIYRRAGARYHYFCTDGASSCSGDKIGYIYYFGTRSPISDADTYISYLKIGGYDDIEAAKAAMFANEHDSRAKQTIESWFEAENLDGHAEGTRNYEDDLEDTIFCNDRSVYTGSLKSKDSSGTEVYFGAYGRNFVKNSNRTFEPSLDCPNLTDSFTVSSANGNGKLKHKIGLATADELTLAGTGSYGAVVNTYNSYISYGFNQTAWTLSPHGFRRGERGYGGAEVDVWARNQSGAYTDYLYSWLRPVVSLKAGTKISSGSGVKTDPYIVP